MDPETAKKVIRFAHYNLRADHQTLALMRDFYVNIVGLRDGSRPAFVVQGYWLYAGSEPVLHLAETPAGQQGHPPGGPGFSHAAFQCTGYDAYVDKLKSAGIKFRPARVPGGGGSQLFLEDPAGNGVELLFEEGARDSA